MKETSKTFLEWEEKQREIYEKFSQDQLKNEGTMAHDLNGKGSYLISYQHKGEVAEKLAEFSRKIGEEVKSMQYPLGVLHTTISDYDLREGFTEEEEIVDKLNFSLMGVYKKLDPVTIEFPKWLVNKGGIVLSGNPSKSFYDNAVKITENSKNYGLDLRMPWGSHVTVARFAEDLKSKDIKGLLKLLKEAPKIPNAKLTKAYTGVIKYNENKINLKFRCEVEL